MGMNKVTMACVLGNGLAVARHKEGQLQPRQRIFAQCNGQTAAILAQTLGCFGPPVAWTRD